MSLSQTHRFTFQPPLIAVVDEVETIREPNVVRANVVVLRGDLVLLDRHDFTASKGATSRVDDIVDVEAAAVIPVLYDHALDP